ncbi:MAG: hypothetical protein FWC73_11210 [Defluviitaleaceae bacterium]|nr:hypothetical protein [Defluviitaleaceae bacterium]
MKQDIAILRELAAQVAEIAALPIQDRTRMMWSNLNSLKQDRPMVMIDQVCWNEMDVNNELTLICQDPELKKWEWELKRILYIWKHFAADFVVEDFMRVPMAVHGINDFGVYPQEDILGTDTTNSVVSHAYVNQFKTIDDLEKIKTPVITYDITETNHRMALAQEIFHDILDVRLEGIEPYLSLWDTIAMWMSVEGVLYTLADDPDLMLALATRVVECFMSGLDQLEAQGLLCGPQSWIHCTGAWTRDLPAVENPTTNDIWMYGLAQMFSTVSPAMFNEFEIEPCMPLFERFGLVYYGCCDPLDLKMKEVRRIPNLRKISMSPWADKRRGAVEIGNDYVFSFKPNPAFLATASFDEDLVRKDLEETKAICKEYDCPLEIILKDISTVKYEPQRLKRWAEIAMEVVNA